ncbi:MAG: hypothetical protein IPM53_10625 [Anaerolineaceae bacterium]|nr:hypothetical protein [Anaerolineaceae bacterium]
MDSLNQHELKHLIAPQEGVHVSMFMPLESEPDKLKKNQIRLQNLMKQGRQMVTAEDFLPPDVTRPDWDAFFQPVAELTADNPYTGDNSPGMAEQGLALFLGPERHHIYHLPLSFDEGIVVGPRFHITPLLPLLDENGRFYLLTLSQNQVRLWHGTRLSLEPVDVPNLPAGADAALSLEDPERELQFHTSTTSGVTPADGGDRPAVFHGHDANTDKKDTMLRYFREVNKALQNVLTDEEAPLILAAVEYAWPIYKEANTYFYLLDEGIAGNPEHLNRQELHTRAWNLMRRHLEKTRQSVNEQYQSVAGTEKTSELLTEIVPAAAYGRIDTLFVNEQAHQLGSFNYSTGEVEIAEADDFACEDLVNLVAASTLQNGGKVYAFQPDEMPTDANLAAIFRYVS